MATRPHPLLFWSPRVLGILLALFLSIFALDVFEEGRGFGSTLLALLIHLLPTGLVLAALAIAWRWEWVGAVLFGGLSLGYLLMAAGSDFHWSAYVAISGPPLVMAVLFLLSWRVRREP